MTERLKILTEKFLKSDTLRGAGRANFSREVQPHWTRLNPDVRAIMVIRENIGAQKFIHDLTVADGLNEILQ